MRVLESPARDLATAAAALHDQMLEAQHDRTLPLETLVEAVRRTNPERAGDAARFGLTYRHIDDAPVELGHARAVPVDVELPAARFGVCLHVERRPSGLRVWLEASREHFDQRSLTQLGASIVDALLDRAHRTEENEDSIVTADAEAIARASSMHESAELARLWHELLGVEPGAKSNFFQDGGTSLLAMRLAALVHKRLGRRLMLNQFLRRPTLEGLAQSIRDDAEHPFAEFSTGESTQGDEPWAVAIPGSAGRAIDLYRLWTEVGRGGAPAVDMIAFDLATIAVAESTTFDPRRFFARFTALTHAHALAQDRRGPVTLVGYSLGGLVAMDMAHRLADLGHTVERVVLLDAYAPPFLARTPAWYLGKLNARARRLGRGAHPTPVRKIEHARGDAHAAEASRAQWLEIHRHLATWRPPTLRVPVTLVRSAPAWKHVRPLRYAATNGLGPRLAGGVDLRVLEVEHLAMLTTGADRVAAEVRPLLTTEPRSATPRAHESPTRSIEHRRV
jgi:thioesterase domain-containing protein